MRSNVVMLQTVEHARAGTVCGRTNLEIIFKDLETFHVTCSSRIWKSIAVW